MGADLGVPLSDLRPLCVSVAGGESRKTFTQFSKRENVKTKTAPRPPEHNLAFQPLAFRSAVSK